jgi:hypothetical protein
MYALNEAIPIAQIAHATASGQRHVRRASRGSAKANSNTQTVSNV